MQERRLNAPSCSVTTWPPAKSASATRRTTRSARHYAAQPASRRSRSSARCSSATTPATSPRAVPVDAYYSPAHQTIAAAIAELHLDGHPVDIVTVADKLGPVCSKRSAAPARSSHCRPSPPTPCPPAGTRDHPRGLATPAHHPHRRRTRASGPHRRGHRCRHWRAELLDIGNTATTPRGTSRPRTDRQRRPTHPPADDAAPRRRPGAHLPRRNPRLQRTIRSRQELARARRLRRTSQHRRPRRLHRPRRQRRRHHRTTHRPRRPPRPALRARPALPLRPPRRPHRPDRHHPPHPSRPVARRHRRRHRSDVDERLLDQGQRRHRRVPQSPAPRVRPRRRRRDPHRPRRQEQRRTRRRRHRRPTQTRRDRRVSYKLETLRPFGRNMGGASRIITTKDRFGHVRAGCAGGRTAGELRLVSSGNTVTLTIAAPQSIVDPDSGFRPTMYMQRVSEAVEHANTAGIQPATNDLKKLVPGKHTSCTAPSSSSSPRDTSTSRSARATLTTTSPCGRTAKPTTLPHPSTPPPTVVIKRRSSSSEPPPVPGSRPVPDRFPPSVELGFLPGRLDRFRPPEELRGGRCRTGNQSKPSPTNPQHPLGRHRRSPRQAPPPHLESRARRSDHHRRHRRPRPRPRRRTRRHRLLSLLHHHLPARPQERRPSPPIRLLPLLLPGLDPLARPTPSRPRSLRSRPPRRPPAPRPRPRTQTHRRMTLSPPQHAGHRQIVILSARKADNGRETSAEIGCHQMVPQVTEFSALQCPTNSYGQAKCVR
jgi:hypothetical protein